MFSAEDRNPRVLSFLSLFLVSYFFFDHRFNFIFLVPVLLLLKDTQKKKQNRFFFFLLFIWPFPSFFVCFRSLLLYLLQTNKKKSFSLPNQKNLKQEQKKLLVCFAGTCLHRRHTDG